MSGERYPAGRQRVSQQWGRSVQAHICPLCHRAPAFPVPCPPSLARHHVSGSGWAEAGGRQQGGQAVLGARGQPGHGAGWWPCRLGWRSWGHGHALARAVLCWLQCHGEACPRAEVHDAGSQRASQQGCGNSIRPSSAGRALGPAPPREWHMPCTHPAHTLTHMHMYTLLHKHPDTHAHGLALTHTNTHPDTHGHTHTLAYTNTQTHTLTHTGMHMLLHIHTLTCTYSCKQHVNTHPSTHGPAHALAYTH